MDARSYFEKLQKMDATVQVPDQYIMAARVAVLLRGLASHREPIPIIAAMVSLCVSFR